MFAQRQNRLCIACSLAVVASLSARGSANGCSYCFNLQGNPFALPHPKAIEIAVATRTAIDNGRIKANPLVPANRVMLGGNGLIALHKVPATSLLVRCIRGRRFPARRSKVLTVHVILVDSSEACRLDIRGGFPILQPNLSSHSDGRIVTTKSILYALCMRQLTLCEAQKLGLVLVEGGAGIESVLAGIVAPMTKSTQRDTKND